VNYQETKTKMATTIGLDQSDSAVRHRHAEVIKVLSGRLVRAAVRVTTRTCSIELVDVARDERFVDAAELHYLRSGDGTSGSKRGI